MSDSEDEDLKRAIALSLQDMEQPPEEPERRTAPVIDLCSDEEDDDLDAPLVSKPTASAGKPAAKHAVNDKLERAQIVDLIEDGEGGVDNILSKPPLSPLPNVAVEAGPKTSGILGMLNRKQMEEERLARARKRMQEADAGDSDASQSSKKRKATSPPADTLPREGKQAIPKQSYTLSSLVSPDIHRSTSKSLPGSQNSYRNPPAEATGPKDSSRVMRNEECDEPTSKVYENAGKSSEILSYRAQNLDSSGIQYPEGVVKRTWAYGYPRRGDDIKIEEVLQKDTLDFAVLSAFQIDPDWIRPKLNERTRVVWVLQAKTEAEKANYRSDAPDNYRFCFPSMQGNVNCMHSKLQLLAHSTHLRVVVPSANLVPYDWGAGGIMENRREADPGTFFAIELIHFLKAMGLEKGIIDSLRRFDFSRTEPLAFVHSIGGSHSGSDLKRTGYAGLGRAVRELDLKSEIALHVDMLASSIGSLNLNFIKAIFLALQGDSGMMEYEWRTNKSSKNKNNAESAVERKLTDDLKKYFRFYFPTKETVANSKGGLGAGGTICIQRQYYEKDTFPRELMRDCKSSLRPGVMMHSKMIFVRPHKPTRNGVKAWAYVGSANLSEAAWGHISKDKTTKDLKITCRNWECGVIIQIPRDATNVNDHDGPSDIDIFTGHIPIPMVVPGEEYAGREPWYFREGRS
ncbi:hypothetical protein HYFRA_00011265 [Hymenoscyphus fraxineus]|uniref:PLD phosphodiesterase domain-containing protein n=1 Tax=Hymenoscyphus fraxineus TaxID=746836 RepID=A0A9N9PU62_9HELO|nr:hypothetical protein HYFRA_00011265 [Hymenoscyphus fraxineus]